MIIEWAVFYIANHQTLYKRVLREAKERIMISIMQMDKPKAMW
jgi:hypothetical protein